MHDTKPEKRATSTSQKSRTTVHGRVTQGVAAELIARKLVTEEEVLQAANEQQFDADDIRGLGVVGLLVDIAEGVRKDDYPDGFAVALIRRCWDSIERHRVSGQSHETAHDGATPTGTSATGAENPPVAATTGAGSWRTIHAVEVVAPESLLIDERLKSLVPRPRAGTRAAMLASIQQDGVREAIHARRCDRMVFDGFTRHELALEAGKKEILVICHDIPADDDLAERTIRAAVERRQLTQWELIRMAANYMEIEAARSRERMLSSGSADPRIDRSEGRISGRTREIVARSLTISSGTMLDRGLYVLRNATRDILKKLDDDDPSVSITGIYEELRRQAKSSPTGNEEKTATTTTKTNPDADEHDHEEPVDAPAPRRSSEPAATAPTNLAEGGCGVTANSEPEPHPQSAQDDQVVEKFMRRLRDLNDGLQPFVEVVARDIMFIADARSATSMAFEIARALEAAYELADAKLRKEIEDGLEEGTEPTEEPAEPGGSEQSGEPAAQEKQAGATRQDGAAEPPIVVLSDQELEEMNNI